MKKVISIVLCLVLISVTALSFAGCSKSKDLKFDIVMITDGGTISDGSYNESAWEGVSEFSESNDMTCKYYQPKVEEDCELTTEQALQYIKIAVEDDAKYIVLPTSIFNVACYEAAKEYTDVNFIILDGYPTTEDTGTFQPLSNVMSFSFDSLQSGFLAGYMAVVAGNTKLGYFGSYTSETSSNYGAGYVQGAAYAADKMGIPVSLDYADYDSPLLDYDYSFTITANYEKIEDVDETCYKVKVINGTGSGTYTEGTNVTITADPAPEGKVFDTWKCTSDTEGVKDKKVNTTSKDKSEMNLLVEECDCTLEATYKDAESTTYPVIVNNEAGNEYSAQYVEAGSSVNVVAPLAEDGMKFDKWIVKSSKIDVDSNIDEIIDDINAKDTWVHIPEDGGDITLTPTYVVSDVPTFKLTVVTGEGGEGQSTGSGSYLTDDNVVLQAALPKDGYIFTNWTNADSDGYGTNIEIEDEYISNTTATMVNRYQAIVEKMYDSGVSIIYAGGNDQANVVSDATWNYSYQKYAIGSENYQSGWDNYYTTTMKDFRVAVEYCLENFKGSWNCTGDCSNEGIYLSSVEDDYKEEYDSIYQQLAKNRIQLVSVNPGADVRLCVNSKCLTLNYWIISK